MGEKEIQEQAELDVMRETIRTMEAELEAVIRAYPEEQILRFFRFAHLTSHLAYVSSHIARCACAVALKLPRSAERTVALRKLLEGKDAAVRAAL